MINVVNTRFDNNSYIKWQSVVYDRDQSEILYETNDPEYLKYKSIDLQEYIDKLLKIIKS